MKRFKSARHVQRFVSIHDPIANLFHLRRDHVTASQYRAARSQTFEDLGPNRRRPFGRLITDQGCAHARKLLHRGQTPIKLTVPCQALPRRQRPDPPVEAGRP